MLDPLQTKPVRRCGRIVCLIAIITAFTLQSVSGYSQDTTSASPTSDPWQGWNQPVYRFNLGVDRFVFKPVATVYKAVIPGFARYSVANFFGNLREVPTFFNDLLQAKVSEAGTDLLRFTTNTTLGIGGLIDVGSMLGMPRRYEDFGQTLAVWGVPQGPYVVIPVFGPATLRDLGGGMVNDNLDPVRYTGLQGPLRTLEGVNNRAIMLDYDQFLTVEYYNLIRDNYIRARNAQIEDRALAPSDLPSFETSIEGDLSY